MELQIFTSTDFGDIRVLEENGEPWFVLSDLSRCLNIDKSSYIARILDDDEIDKIEVDTSGGMQTLSICNESGMYKAIFSSRMDKAKQFKNWVCRDVLPAIRKTGRYNTEKKSNLEVLKSIIEEQIEAEKRLKAIESDVEKLKTGVKFVDDSYALPSQIGAMMSPQLSAVKVNKLLREAGLQMLVNGQWVPTSAGMSISQHGQRQLENGKIVYQLYWKRSATLLALNK